jgi:predicted O-methyltransferase YrrM
VDALRHLPPVALPVAEEIARAGDLYRQNHTAVEGHTWSGDVRAHFELSSSAGEKGRILTTVVRFSRSCRVVELGTAYGISTIFILNALEKQRDARVVTVEGFEPQYSLASATLAPYGDRVECKFGVVQEILPRLVPALGAVDMLFHDAGHSRADYVRDFELLVPALAPGAVAVFDDIRYADARFYQSDPQAYEGWCEVVSHPRVRQAVEIDGDVGLLMVG